MAEANSSSSGTLICESSRYSTSTLTSQTLDVVSLPVLSLLFDPFVSIEDLQDIMFRCKHRVASTDDIISRDCTISTRVDRHISSSLDALHVKTSSTIICRYGMIRQNVTQKTLQLWDNIVRYLLKHMENKMKKQKININTAQHHRGCYLFGFEILSCLEMYFGDLVRCTEGDLLVVCGKLISSGIIENAHEKWNRTFSETELFHFISSTTSIQPNTNKKDLIVEIAAKTSNDSLAGDCKAVVRKMMCNMWRVCRKHLMIAMHQDKEPAMMQDEIPLTPYRVKKKDNSFNEQKQRNRERKECLKEEHEDMHYHHQKDSPNSQWVVYGFL